MKCPSYRLSDTEYLGKTLRQMVAFGHIYIEQSGQRDSEIQRTSKGNPRYITENVDGYFADIGG